MPPTESFPLPPVPKPGEIVAQDEPRSRISIVANRRSLGAMSSQEWCLMFRASKGGAFRPILTATIRVSSVTKS